MWIKVAISWALEVRWLSWVVCLGSAGAFQWPKVRCDSFAVFAVMGINAPVSESVNKISVWCFSMLGFADPSGWGINVREWKEHFGSSSLPPEHQRRSFQVCASDSIFFCRGNCHNINFKNRDIYLWPLHQIHRTQPQHHYSHFSCTSISTNVHQFQRLLLNRHINFVFCHK